MPPKILMQFHFHSVPWKFPQNVHIVYFITIIYIMLEQPKLLSNTIMVTCVTKLADGSTRIQLVDYFDILILIWCVLYPR